MTSKRLAICSAGILVGVAWYSTHALADGECARGYRDTTVAERTAMKNVLTAALAALPPTPTGWNLTADGDTSGVRSICRDFEAQPFSYGTRRFLNRVDDRESRDRTLNATLDQSNRAQAAKQPRIDALNGKIEEIGKKLAEAATKGDLVRAEALNKEIDALGQQLHAVYDENDQTQQLEAAGLENARDTEINIEVTVNAARETPGDGAQPIAKPAGAQSAYRWSDAPGSGTQDHALLLLGTWKAVENHFESMPRSGVTPAAASTVSIRIDADPTRIESLISAIRLGDMAATLR